MKCDVLILGAGLAGGLPAAAYLQKAGLSVTLVERAIETGKFYQSYDLLPGVRFDHSPVNFSAMSPAILDLDLERHGYAPRLQTLLHSVTTMSGTNITFYPDLERTTAALTMKVRPHPAQSRQRVLRAGELDLDLGLMRLRVVDEDLQDQLGAVDDGGLGELLEGAHLRGREVVVDEDHAGLELVGEVAHLLGLALAEVEPGVDGVASLDHQPDDLRARRLGERRFLSARISANTSFTSCVPSRSASSSTARSMALNRFFCSSFS